MYDFFPLICIQAVVQEDKTTMSKEILKWCHKWAVQSADLDF